MRLRGILALALLLALVVPTASAGGDPPGPDPQCVGASTTGPIEAVVALRVEQFGCETTIVLLSAADCAGTPADGTTDLGSGILRVVVPHCAVPQGVPVWLPVCPHHGGTFGAVGEVAYRECEVQVHLVDDVVCTKLRMDPVRHDVVDEDRVHVTYTTCRPYAPLSSASDFRCAYLYEDVHGPDGVTSVEGEYTCWFNVVVNEGIQCDGETVRSEDQVLNVNVVTYSCDETVSAAGPASYEAGACVRDPGGDLLGVSDACTQTFTCLGLAQAKQVRHETPYGTVDANVCIVGPATGPALTASGGPCDRLERSVQTQEVGWSMDDRCRHVVYLDAVECLNQSQWTKTWETMEVHPNLTIHYTLCRLG